MRGPLQKKLIIIALLVVGTKLILESVVGIVAERAEYRNEAKSSIAQAWSGPQAIIGPLLRIPHTIVNKKSVYNPHLGVYEEQITKEEKIDIRHPSTLVIETQTKSEERYRGIYSFPVHFTQVRLQGSFNIDPNTKVNDENSIYDQASTIEIGLGDVKGIASEISLKLNGKEYSVAPGTNLPMHAKGVHAITSDLSAQAGPRLDFEIAFSIKGLEALHVAALGENTSITMQADWPHPKFVGEFLPVKRNITQDGFTAEWSLTHFATGIADTLRNCGTSICDFEHQLLGFELYQPVDMYQQTVRSLKYGILFPLMTFASFFVFELLKGFRIHPLQYAFVGGIQALFFLLLISLSEHSSFGLSYALSTIACIAVLSFYLSYVLKSAQRGGSFGVAFAALYVLLYFLLQSQDYALLLGSTLLFVSLSGIMVSTRKVDWYALGAAKEEPTA